MKLSVEDTDAYEVAVFSGVLLTASSSSKLMAVAMFFALRLLTNQTLVWFCSIMFDRFLLKLSLTFRSFEIPSAFASRTRCDPVNTLHLHLQSKSRRCHLGSDDFLSQSLQNEPANFCRLQTFGPRGKFRGFPEQRIRVLFSFSCHGMDHGVRVWWRYPIESSQFVGEHTDATDVGLASSSRVSYFQGSPYSVANAPFRYGPFVSGWTWAFTPQICKKSSDSTSTNCYEFVQQFQPGTLRKWKSWHICNLKVFNVQRWWKFPPWFRWQNFVLSSKLIACNLSKFNSFGVKGVMTCYCSWLMMWMWMWTGTRGNSFLQEMDKR